MNTDDDDADDLKEMFMSLPPNAPRHNGKPYFQPAAPPQPYDDGHAMRLETMARLVMFLAKCAKKPADIGKRVLLLAFLLDKSERRTQRQLSRALGISCGRTSQVLNAVRRDMHRIHKDL